MDNLVLWKWYAQRTLQGSRPQSANEQIYREAETLLGISGYHQTLADIGTPSLYMLQGGLGSFVRGITALYGSYEIGQGTAAIGHEDYINGIQSLTSGLLNVSPWVFDNFSAGGVGKSPVYDESYFNRYQEPISFQLDYAAKGLGGVVNLADTGIQWGKGISNQGKPFELFVQGLLPEGTIDLNLIKTNFNVFDHLTSDGTAVSTKTMDTVGSVTYQKPSAITRTLNSYVDDMVNFLGDGKKGGSFFLANSKIKNKVMQLPIPYETTPVQMTAIAKSIQYAENLPTPIKIIVTKVK